MRTGKDLGLTSVQGKGIYKKVNESGGEYKNYVKCNKCRGNGFIRDVITNKTEYCPICKGWGFIKK